MILTIDNKEWRHKFDKDKTYEVVCYLFALNYKKTGLTYVLLEDLCSLLFLIDITSLQETYCVVTGDEYFFDSYGLLTAKETYYSIKYPEIEGPYIEIFDYYYNIFNKKIIVCKDITVVNSFKWDHLSEYLEELILKTYTDYMCNNMGTNKLRVLFESDIKAQFSIPMEAKYITLDFLINKLNLDKEAVTEMLALHNVGR